MSCRPKNRAVIVRRGRRVGNHIVSEVVEGTGTPLAGGAALGRTMDGTTECHAWRLRPFAPAETGRVRAIAPSSWRRGSGLSTAFGSDPPCGHTHRAIPTGTNSPHSYKCSARGQWASGPRGGYPRGWKRRFEGSFCSMPHRHEARSKRHTWPSRPTACADATRVARRGSRGHDRRRWRA